MSCLLESRGAVVGNREMRMLEVLGLIRTDGAMAGNREMRILEDPGLIQTDGAMAGNPGVQTLEYLGPVWVQAPKNGVDRGQEVELVTLKGPGLLGLLGLHLALTDGVAIGHQSKGNSRVTLGLVTKLVLQGLVRIDSRSNKFICRDGRQ